MIPRQRRVWTAEEDQLLFEAVNQEEDSETLKPSDWCSISKNIPNRTNKDCRKRWMNRFTSAGALQKTTKGAWTEEEDEQLRAGVEAYGPRWCKVAEMVLGRNSDQCAKRWKESLNPLIDHSKWSLEEDEILLKVVSVLGRKWAQVVKQYFPGRTGLSAKNRYNCLVNHRRPVVSESSDLFSPLEWSTSSSLSTPTSSSTSPYYLEPDEPIYTPVTEFTKIVTKQESSHGSGTVTLAQLNDIPFVYPPFSPQFGNISCDGFNSNSSIEGCHSDGRVLKLYGSSRCCSTAKVAVVLHEKQIAFELESPQSTSTEAQPYIDDNGIILHGCRNICQYLATRYAERGAKLLIPDLSDISAAGQLAFAESRNFEIFASKALYETIIKRQEGTLRLLPSELFTGGSALQELSDNMDGYESILSCRRYLAGNEITLVDLYHLPYGEMLCNAGVDVLFAKGPNVSRWWTDISTRPSWIAIRNGVPLRG